MMKFLLVCLILVQPICTWAASKWEFEFTRKNRQGEELSKPLYERALAAVVSAGYNPSDFTFSIEDSDAYISSKTLICKLSKGTKWYKPWAGSDSSKDSLECYNKYE